VAIDAGFAGDSDSYGAESRCVAKTPGGYLMVYGESDEGDQSPPHGDVGGLPSLGCSGDHHAGCPEDAGGANHPCLLMTGERWWLFYRGYPGLGPGQRSVLVAAVSQTGASWDRVGTILEPEAGEVAVSHPCALEISRTIYTFYASDVGGPIRIALATSSEGLSWDRRGTVLEPAGQGPDGSSVHTPCVVRLHDGSVGMWYAGIPIGDEALGYRICSARFPGPWST
jgi:predicted GH43/DUF377 family glycosyl hydrolase